MAGTAAWADSIDPDSFSADLAVGESVTIEKTVTISEGGPTDAIIDVHFLFDTSGSMSGEIAAAKGAADALFTGLVDDFGDVAAGVGVFSEGASLTDPDPRGNAVYAPGLTTDGTTFSDNVNDVTLGNPDGGGDRPESGYTAIALAGGELDWRAGSNRFMFVFTDADGKGDLAGAAAALAADDISLVVLAYRGTTLQQNTYGNLLGADVFAATTSIDGIIDDVTAGITAGFAEYDEVTVSDLGAGLPEIQVTTVCTGADIGACVGDTAVGDYDRSVEREFTFDVTFTRLAAGDSAFETLALVDGGAVAREADRFPDGTSPIPVPAGLPLLLTGLLGMGYLKRRRRAA